MAESQPIPRPWIRYRSVSLRAVDGESAWPRNRAKGGVHARTTPNETETASADLLADIPAAYRNRLSGIVWLACRPGTLLRSSGPCRVA